MEAGETGELKERAHIRVVEVISYFKENATILFLSMVAMLALDQIA